MATRRNETGYPTKTIPTDRHGNVYYGPTTLAGAMQQIQDGRPAAEMAGMMDRAGYPGIARSIRVKYDLPR